MTRKQSRPTTTLPDYVIHLTVTTHTFHLHMQSVDKTRLSSYLHSFSLTKVGNLGKKPRAVYTVTCWPSIVKEQINWETLINEFDETLFAANASSETQRQCRRGQRTTERRYWLMSKDFVKILFPSYTDTQYPRRTHSLTAIFTAAELRQGIFASRNRDYWLSKCM